jgi:AcrR family transcriptional regulator
MPRPDRSAERRRELAPVLARAFAELGYRRTTTAALAERCGVQEKALYRLWPDKRAMFLAALDQVFAESEAVWERLASERGKSGSVAERLLAHEAQHHGEHRLYRILFAGLSETDDPAIREALGALYGRFQRLIQAQIERHRRGRTRAGESDPALAAWAIVGLGTVANIGRELELQTSRERTRLLGEVGARLLGGAP